MSIKIYYAWRCPLNRLNDTIDYVHEDMTNIIIDLLNPLIDGVKEDEETLGPVPKHIKEHEQFENILPTWKHFKKAEKIFDLCKESAKSSMKSMLDIECGLNIWIHDGYAYFVPICPQIVLNKYTLPEWCEDYCYWDNVDEPENVTEEDWKQRRQTWEKVCLENHNKRRLFHEIIAAKTDLDLFDLQKKMKLNQFDFWDYVSIAGMLEK